MTCLSQTMSASTKDHLCNTSSISLSEGDAGQAWPRDAASCSLSSANHVYMCNLRRFLSKGNSMLHPLEAVMGTITHAAMLRDECPNTGFPWSKTQRNIILAPANPQGKLKSSNPLIFEANCFSIDRSSRGLMDRASDL